MDIKGSESCLQGHKTVSGGGRAGPTNLIAHGPHANCDGHPSHGHLTHTHTASQRACPVAHGSRFRGAGDQVAKGEEQLTGSRLWGREGVGQGGGGAGRGWGREGVRQSGQVAYMGRPRLVQPKGAKRGQLPAQKGTHAAARCVCCKSTKVSPGWRKCTGSTSKRPPRQQA
jgi:hypothetical protein